ncbi:MAG: D-alanyl-D-alanine carboxypeptidase [uncultured Thermomicrobiales bacterium]|uniref:D-alanyl-D-alanine carboxypeptidase n=1 Tax=uncultured Thermomicrobiales bacterium TaxID=1645740 RepID=A0A6J4VC06_9BACT|nr:MAG: D-alanyl-D-alanine carboxypeptidase [uncultured Thermomicrobiales bacterium]
MTSWLWSASSDRARPLPLLIALVLVLACPAVAAAKPLDAPEVTAASVFAYDVATGETIYDVDADERRAMGSLAKIMTALVTLDHRTRDAEVVIAEADMVPAGYSTMWLQVGDILTVEQLLTDVLVPSAGDAALALARDVGAELGGTDDPQSAVAAFVDAMNERAAGLGLDDTRFANPVGEDDADAWSTAHDIARLFHVAQEDALLAGMLAQADYGFLSVGLEQREYGGLSTNELAGQLGVTGAKTGSTDAAGGCVVLARTANRGRNTVIVAILGSGLAYDETGVRIRDERWTDARTLITDMDARWKWGAPSRSAAEPGATTAMAPAGERPSDSSPPEAATTMGNRRPERETFAIALAGGMVAIASGSAWIRLRGGRT